MLDAAGALRGRGVEQRDRVALVLPDGPEMAVAFLAVSAVAPAVPINPRSRRTEFERYFEDLRITWLLTSEPDDSNLIGAAQARGVKVIQLAVAETKPAGTLQLAGARDTALTDVPASGTDVALVLTTSGTASRPKIVALTRANILASAGSIAAGLDLRAEDRCQVVMPLFHAHGLIGGLLASIAAGASVICCPGFDAACFFDWMDQGQPTWYTAVPTMHQAILMRARAHRDVIARCRLRFVRSASASLTETLQRALEEAFGAPVIQAYGMTEASHQIAQNPLPPAARKPGSVGLPFGTEVAILDEVSRPLARGIRGEIAIRGINVITEYERGGAVNDQSFADGWLKTGDSGYIDDDGYVFITGRLKEIINRGGEKVNPPEIDDVLLAHPCVAQAAAFAIPHATLGQDVAAAVVLHPGETCDEQDLREWVSGLLAQFKVPARVIVLDELPKGPTGKVQRNLLADQLGMTFAPLPTLTRPAFVAPEGRFETSLATLWSGLLGLKRVDRRDNFFELGGDSIAGARLLERVEMELGADISFIELFDRPVLSDMARTIADHTRGERASPTRPNHLARDATEGQSSRPQDTFQDAPLSFGQERLWFLDQLRPGNTVFTSSIRLRISGPLLVEALGQGLTTIVNRHDVLRASFPAVDGRPIQRTAARDNMPLDVVDLRSTPSSDRMAELDLRMASELNRPFDLAHGPLLRATLFVLDRDDHALVIAIHHIVFDGWSRSIFLRELGVAYEQIARGNRASLPPLPSQYTDYARRETASGDLADRHLAFWTAQLASLPGLNLPYDRPQPDGADFRAERHARPLPHSLAHGIRTLSRGEGVTPFMTLLAAFSILLSRLSSTKDVVIGSPIAGRTSGETEQLIGFFVKTLILRVDLSGTPSFRDLLQRVRTVTLNAVSHQDLPFQRLVNVLKPARFADRNPLFDVAINFRNYPDAELDVAGLESRSIAVKEELSEFPLTLDIENEDGTLSVQLTYQQTFITGDRIAAMLDQFESLLQQIVAQPSAAIDAYSVALPLPISDEVSGSERRKLLVDWNNTRAEYPAHLGLHQLFEAQADRTPEATAVVSGEAVCSFAALNARANQLARVLRRNGVGRDAVVGVCLERSINLAVALLGVLKAGAAYLPLDPTYPEARLSMMLEDASAPALVTESALAARIQGTSARVLWLDQDQALAREATANLENIATPDSLAYVLFTSGSTGRPKGVMIPHRAVCNYIWWMGSTIPFAPDDRVLQRTPISFDISVWEIFAPLSFGATLVMAPPGGTFDPPELVDVVIRHGVTVLQFVPSLLGLWLDEPTTSSCHTVRHVFCAGAVLAPTLRDRFFDRFDRTALYNVYGPTETCICSLMWRCEASSSTPIVPIGRPVANTQLYVLGPDLNVLPIGAAGELYIAGDGLARGYINRPDLTAERFLPNPFTPTSETRMYRTGDRVRYLPDGNVEFLGRDDDQVKIRGVRIELQEVSATLAQHPGIQEAVVVARHEAPGDPQLAAYYVARETKPTEQELRGFLRQRLPEGAVPSWWMRLDGLPLGPNGKIDRRSLPEPRRSARAERLVLPRTNVERRLSRIWSEVLQVAPLGIDEDFFELGGHSLLATQAISRINAEFGRRVPLRHLFEHATIEGLAKVIEGEPAVAPQGPIRRSPRTASSQDQK